VPLKRRAAPRAELMGWDGSAWQKVGIVSGTVPHLKVVIGDDTTPTLADVRAPVDGEATRAGPAVGSHNLGFNGSRWDRWRNNTEKTVLPSGTRTVSGNSADQVNYNARGAILILRVTAVSGTSPTLDVFVEAKDPASGVYDRIARFTQMTAAGWRDLVVYPGATDVQGYVADQNDVPLPRTWRISYTIGGTNPSFTFSVGVSYIV